MMIDAKDKMIQPLQNGEKGIEQRILRDAFDVDSKETAAYLPKEILWRQKEQFSDGVGYGWIDALRQHAESVVSDEMFANVKQRFPYNPPVTKEA